MASYETRIDGKIKLHGSEEEAINTFEIAVEDNKFTVEVLLCRVTIVESAKRGVVRKKRRGRKKVTKKA